MKIFLKDKWVTFKTWDERAIHRINGPACVWGDGEKWWLIFDNSHREDGPARMMPGGDEGWYLLSYQLTKTEVLSVVANKSSDTYEVGDVLIKKPDLPKDIDDDFPDIYWVKNTDGIGFKVKDEWGKEFFTASQLNLAYNKVV